MEEIEKNRLAINEIDKQMAALFEQRMTVCESIADYKKRHGLPVYDAAREFSLIQERSKDIKDDLHREYYTKFLQGVMDVSKDFQQRKMGRFRVAYSGTEGAYGYIAAKKLYPFAELIPFPHFASAYNAVEEGKADCAVLPIENSYAGDVGTVMDLTFSGNLFINRVLELDIVHNLIAKKGTTIDKIKTIVSHPQALEQCEGFINKHNWDVVEYANTALAAKFVKEKCDETVATIASEETAKVFDLEILESGVNTGKSNTTRFAVFSPSQNIPSADSKNENEHFIIVFTTKNEAGTLAQALNILGAHNFNMRNLRSRPMKELLWNYYFFVEAEGNIGTTEGKNMLRELSAVCARLKLVGTYR